MILSKYFKYQSINLLVNTEFEDMNSLIESFEKLQTDRNHFTMQAAPYIEPRTLG